MNVFYGRKIDSISPTGRVFYLQTKSKQDSLTYLGNPQPKFTWSINNTFTYKSFDFSIFIEGRHGNKIFNNTALLLEKSNVNLAQNTLQRFADDNISWTRYTPLVSDRYIEDGSFVRISNLTLGYTHSFKQNNYINKIRFYLTGSNLFVFTNYEGYDPDVTSSTDMNDIRSFGIDISNYPKSRMFLAGLNVTF